MIAQGGPEPLPLLTVALALSGIFVLAGWARRRAAAPAEQPPEAGTPYEPMMLLAWACLAFLVYALGGALLRPGSTTGLALAGLFGTLAIAALFWRVLLGRLLRPRYGVGRLVLTGLMGAWAVLPVVYGLAIVVQLLSSPAQQHAVDVLRKRSEGWPWVALGAVLVAPLLEEIIFRGMLYPGIRRVGGRRIALVVSSLLFGLVHEPVAWAPMTAFGVAMVVLLETTGSLLPAVVAHFAFNALTVGQLIFGVGV